MDKQEYKLKADEIKRLITKRDFFKAVKIADEIDWKRVRSVAMLCTVSDLYKANRRYKESKELLLMAYERNPNGRMILYSLCELCIKMGEVVQAIEYYKEFVQLASMDNGKYILQYKLYVAQDVSLEERIAVLEELKKRDYREKWGYELAYLYHRIGLSTKCVEECDELILWFSEGRYVKKAMELKMLHQPLTLAQEASYNSFVGKNAELPKVEPEEEKPIEDQIEVTPMKVGKYDTINLQKALAESMKEVLAPAVSEPEKSEAMGEVTAQIMAPMLENTENVKEIFFEDKTGEIPESPVQVTMSESTEEVVSETENMLQEEAAIPAMAKAEFIVKEVEKEEPDVTVYPDLEIQMEIVEEKNASQISESKEEHLPESQKTEVSKRGIPYQVPDDATKEIPSIREIMSRPLTEKPVEIPKMTTRDGYTADGIPTSMADYLSQEYDGQISLVVEERAKIEKQITGQMNIEEVLIEWEKTKKQYEEKRKAERTQKVLEQTGSMFTEFEARIRDGILERLQKEEQLEEENIIQKENPTEENEKFVAEPIEELELESETEIIVETEKQEPVLTVEDSEEKAENPTMEEPVEKQEFLAEIEDDKIESSEEVGEEKTEPVEAEEEYESKQETVEVDETKEQIDSKEDEEEETLRKIRQAQEGIRELSEEEKVLFAPFIQTKGAKKRFMKALDLISLAAYTGNVIVTGEADSDTVKLAKNIMKDIQMTDSNFSGVIAKVSGASLNSKSIDSTVAKLNNGGLIIEKASEMNSQAVMKLLKALNQEKTGIVVILEDNKKAMKRMLAAYPSMSTFFNARIEVEELNNDALAAYGKQYAAHKEYAIDDLGMLALQTLIEDRQTSDHLVTVAEVRELVDDAIDSANRKNIGHFLDIIFGRRYDEEDMIILREKDFI